MTTLSLSSDLKLPLRSVTEKLAWIGTTGSGKTYGASKLAELFWAAHAQFIVLDPVGVWYGLRLQDGGRNPSDIQIPIFGGLHGDVPLEPTGGALVANLIVDRAISVILDVSQFESDTQKARFATDFADRFFFRKKAVPSAVHLFVEECQEFVPQYPQKGEERMLHAFTRVQKLGRNFGIGSSYITQRPQEVHKKALNLAQTLFVFRTTGPHERKAIEGWIQDKGLDQNIAGDLPKLATGRCHIWSPEFLEVSKVVTIKQKKTFNASATPEVGTKAQSRDLAPIDLDRIRKDMASTIEKAKAEDPVELRRQILDLTKKVRQLEQRPEVQTKTVTVEIPVIGKRDLKKLNDMILDLQAASRTYDESQMKMRTISTHIGKACADLSAVVGKNYERQFAQRHTATTTVNRAVFLKKEPGTVPAKLLENGKISSSQQRILNALAWAEGVGMSEVDKAQVALLSDQSPTSGGYFNSLGALRSAGLIEYPKAKTVALTMQGKAHAEYGNVPSTSEELQEMLFRKLSKSQTLILQALIKSYPTTVGKDELAEQTGQSKTSGGYFNNLGRLRSLGLIDYPRSGQVVAKDVLFLNQ